MEWIAQPEAWIALLTLTALEIVLGIDNIIFLSILVGRLPPERRQTARVLGLGLAMGTRIALLLSLTWMMSLTTPIVTVLDHSVSIPCGVPRSRRRVPVPARRDRAQAATAGRLLVYLQAVQTRTRKEVSPCCG